MTKVLTEAEIAELLTAINAGDEGFETIGDFENYLKKRRSNPEKPYGIFDKDISICRYFGSKNNEKILADIKIKNEKEGLGNIKIPNTDITLINYSFCSNCNSIYSFKEVIDYYKKPKPDSRFINISVQYRNDTRVYCYNCNSHFLPSLVISDGTPVNEVQFLCRAQVVEEVEKYLLDKNIKVLTRKKSNIVYHGNFKAIKNDVSIKDLEKNLH
jgi:hypothetical protein